MSLVSKSQTCVLPELHSKVPLSAVKIFTTVNFFGGAPDLLQVSPLCKAQFEVGTGTEFIQGESDLGRSLNVRRRQPTWISQTP